MKIYYSILINVLFLFQLLLSDVLIFSSNDSLIAGRKISCEIKYITDEAYPLEVGEVISIQLPPFWQVPKATTTKEDRPIISLRFSNEQVRGSITVSSKSIDGYFSETEITVINVIITQSFMVSKRDTITLRLGAEPVIENGIRISRFAGDQRIYFKRNKQIQPDVLASNKDFVQLNIKSNKTKRILAYLESSLDINKYSTVKISYLDEYGNRDLSASEKVFLFSSDSVLIEEVKIDSGYGSSDVYLQCQQIDSIKVVAQGGFSTWTNPYVYDEQSTGSIWWGDLHTHAIYSGHGRGYINDLLDYAMRTTLLDFVAYTEHDWIYKSVQDEVTKELNDSYKPNTFVTFNGLEWTSRVSNNVSGHGHINVISRNAEPIVRMNISPSTKPDALFPIARNNNYLLAINHPLGAYAYDWDYFDNTIKNVEMVSDGYYGILSNEYTILGMYGLAVSDVIKKKYRIGFIGVSDNHYCQPGVNNSNTNKSSGLTAVIAKNLDRESIFDALKARHNYATTGSRIYLDFRSGNYMMGDIIPSNQIDSGKIEFKIKVVGTARLSSVDVIKNGDLYKRYSNLLGNNFETVYQETNLDRETSYYVRVIQADNQVAWSSPIWINMDTIVGDNSKSNTNGKFSITILSLLNSEILFSLLSPKTETIKLSIYDILGRKIKSFVDVNIFEGKNKILWNTENDFGNRVNSGSYFARFEGTFGTKTLKVFIIK